MILATPIERWAPTFTLWLWVGAGIVLFVLLLLFVVAVARAIKTVGETRRREK